MSLIYAVDPGTLQSALVIVDTRDDGSLWPLPIREACTILNAALLPRLETAPLGATFVIEQFESFGMAIGFDSLETVFWTGRMFEAWPNSQRYRLPRRPIKLHLCGDMRAKDANIRAALLDRFGPGRELAVGTTKHRGPLYGLKGHEWAALAVAITWADTHQRPQPVAIAPRATEA